MKKEKITDQRYWSISSLQTDYLNLDIISGSGRNMKIENLVQTKCNFCGGSNYSAETYVRNIRKDK